MRSADLAPVLLEVILHDHGQRSLEPGAIGVVDKAVTEHAKALVSPQPNVIGRGLDQIGIAHRHSLEHLGQIAKVESVVGLGRGRQQLRRDPVVQRNASRDRGRRRRLDGARETA